MGARGQPSLTASVPPPTNDAARTVTDVDVAMDANVECTNRTEKKNAEIYLPQRVSAFRHWKTV